MRARPWLHRPAWLSGMAQFHLKKPLLAWGGEEANGQIPQYSLNKSSDPTDSASLVSLKHVLMCRARCVGRGHETDRKRFRTSALNHGFANGWQCQRHPVLSAHFALVRTFCSSRFCLSRAVSCSGLGAGTLQSLAKSGTVFPSPAATETNLGVVIPSLSALHRRRGLTQNALKEDRETTLQQWLECG